MYSTGTHLLLRFMSSIRNMKFEVTRKTKKSTSMVETFLEIRQHSLSLSLSLYIYIYIYICAYDLNYSSPH
jgi:hypothetical protein